jgi:hypothetical protein
MGNVMDFNRRAGGHNFDFDTDVCTRCTIGRRQYLASGKPVCLVRDIVPATAIRVPPLRTVGPLLIVRRSGRATVQ